MSEPFLSSTWYRAAGLRPRLRPHVEVVSHAYGGRSWYILHDRAGARTHRVTPASYLLLGRMDGATTLDAIWTDVAVQLEDDAPTQDDVLRLMAQLHANDLLQLDTPPQVSELLERYVKRQRLPYLAFVKNPMSGKIPLVDPDRMLAALVRAGRPLHGWPLTLAWLACVLPAAALVPLHWAELTANVADRVLLTQNLVALALVYPFIKLMHEIGHGYAVKSFGGEAHEAGLMLLVFYPTPYIDASASLALPNRFARALVGVAGVAVEMVLAALSFYLWSLAETGWVRAIAFDVMLIAGVSTLVVNGNPLLRFDAYYILTDLLEIPNLGARSGKYWTALVDRYAFGARDRTTDATSREAGWFLVYAPAAFAYRLLITFTIALFVASEFLAAGVALAAWSLFFGIVMPVVRGFRHVVTGAELHRNRRRALTVTMAGLAGLGLAIFALPLPMHTNAEGVIWLPDEAQVRAETTGFISRLLAEPGSPVVKGQALVESVEPLLAAGITSERAKVEELQLRYVAESVTDRVKATITGNELGETRAKLDRLVERGGKLLVRSASEGTLTVPGAADLPGRFFREGQVIAYITPQAGRTVRVVVTQDDIDLVRHHLLGIEAKLAGRLDETFAGNIAREVPAARNEVPSRALASSGGGVLATDPGDRDGLQALQRLFQFDVALTPDPAESRYGGRVYLRFVHDHEPLGFQLYRRLRQLFLSRFGA